MKKVRFAIVGIGNMGTAHAMNLIEGHVTDGELVAICDIKETRRIWAKDNLPGVQIFEDYDQLLVAKSCDAIIIATPHYDHPGMAMKALKNDYHVLSEKPIGVYCKDVEVLNQLALESNKVFTIMYNQRTNPVYQKVKSLIESGEIGDIIRVNWTITNWFRSQRYYDSGGWRATWEGEGGGVLLNQCPHQIDLLQWIFGMPVKVRAFAGYGKYHDIEVDDDVTAYLEFENGGTGTFITCTGEAPGINRLEVSGDYGRLVIEDNEITFQENREGLRNYSKTTAEGFKAPDVNTYKIPVEGTESGHVGIMEDFVKGILQDKDQLAPGIEGINGLRLTNAMYLSSWTDTLVDIPVDTDVYLKALKEKINNSTIKKTVKEVVLDVKGSH